MVLVWSMVLLNTLSMRNANEFHYYELSVLIGQVVFVFRSSCKVDTRQNSLSIIFMGSSGMEAFRTNHRL